MSGLAGQLDSGTVRVVSLRVTTRVTAGGPRGLRHPYDHTIVAGYGQVILANRYLLGGVAATCFALSTLLAGLHAAGAGRGGAIVQAGGGPRLPALAASSLTAGISSGQGAADDLQRRMA